MTQAPTTAMVLAAGVGSRMRPLTDDRPKALVEVAGRPLIDHMLDRLGDVGVTRAVVNVHAFADRLEAHLAQRSRAPAIVISDERDELLETGGGLKKARALLGEAPVFVANIDSVWIETGAPALPSLAKAFDPATMDVCLLLTPTEAALGFDGPGDFFKHGDGRLTFRGEAPSAPFAYIGAHICKPQIVDGEPLAPFSLARIWRRLAPLGRLHGAVLEGEWMHVGDPAARDAAEARLAADVGT
jgi:MurNAc alpha-1-phosphate uridylyltransferase